MSLSQALNQFAQNLGRYRSYMGSMTENIADKAINDTRIVKQFTNPVKEPIDSDINLFPICRISILFCARWGYSKPIS